MNKKEIIIPVNSDSLNIIYNCIIEHWPMPQYAKEMSVEDFKILESLRRKISKLRDDSRAKELRLEKRSLQIIIKAYEIGFEELTKNGDDFHPIIGEDIKRGEEVLNTLKSYVH